MLMDKLIHIAGLAEVYVLESGCVTSESLNERCEEVVACQLYDDIMKVPQNETWPDQWEVQIMARILKRNTVIYVSDPKRKRLLEDMKIRYAADLGEALALARELKGRDASITVVPNGVSVVVEE